MQDKYNGQWIVIYVNVIYLYDIWQLIHSIYYFLHRPQKSGPQVAMGGWISVGLCAKSPQTAVTVAVAVITAATTAADDPQCQWYHPPG